MKTLLKSAIVGLGMLLTSAVHAGQSQLNLKMFDNSAFSVMFDGSWMSQQTPQFTISGINDGAHMLKVVRYVIDPYCGLPQPKVVFWGNVVIPPRSKVFAIIDCEGQYKVSCIEPMHGNGWNNGGGWSSNNGGGWNQGGGYNGNNTGWNQGGGNNGYNCGPQAMSPESFQMLKCAIESKPFDNTKLEIAKQAINMNYLSTQQVSCLVGMLTFEHYKLDLAKYAYGRTIDKQNYFMVNNCFTFSSSVNELNYYIAHI